jgi:predicted O-methyltransferase YrrM
LLAQKEHRLRSFVAYVAAERAQQPLAIVEVGTWLGWSAIAWHTALRDLCGGSGRIVCVDPWVTYEGKAGIGQQLDNDQNQLLESGEAFATFLHNIAAAGATDRIEIKRGASNDILPALPSGGFDIVYIDGDHSYAQVRQDLANAIPLVRDGGLICGDDLEVLFPECNQMLCAKWAELGAEYVRDPATGLGFHPGVTLAVWRQFGPVSRWGLTWAMQRRGESWVPITLAD